MGWHHCPGPAVVILDPVDWVETGDGGNATRTDPLFEEASLSHPLTAVNKDVKLGRTDAQLACA
jgi:hypothetical protein